MRTGYTTGSCATAAAKAAVHVLIGHEAPKIVTVHLPIGKDAALTVFRCESAGEEVTCSVIKDGR